MRRRDFLRVVGSGVLAQALPLPPSNLRILGSPAVAVTYNTVGSASTNDLCTSPTHTFANIVNIPNTTGLSIVGAIYGSGSDAISGVTLGGAAVTLLAKRASNDNVQGGLWFGYILHSTIGSTGLKDMVVTHTMGANRTIIGGVICIDGQHATTPLGTVSMAAGSGAPYAASVTDSVTNDLVVGCIATGSVVGTANNTERWKRDVNGATAAGNAAGATAPGASGTVTISWGSSFDWWVAGAITVKQAAGGSPTAAQTWPAVEQLAAAGGMVGRVWR